MAAPKQKKVARTQVKRRSGRTTPAAAPVPAAAAQPATLCVVGIGASAGGFEAINEFLGAMPPDAGLAFVVVQHLSPIQKSLSAELFAKRTAMNVLQAEDGLQVKANVVYTTPADVYVSIDNGVLRFERPADPRGRRLPIDHFFRSLGEDQKERAIGIVLSGTGTDGTLGLKHVVAHGGIVLVQAPETAQFDGMPRSALATDLVTHVLPVDKMPEVLIAYARHPYASSGRDSAMAAEAEDASLRVVTDLMRARHGYSFDGYKRRMLVRRVQRRMGLRGIGRVADYATVMRKEPREVDALFKDLLIGVTDFFRDGDAWNALDKEVIAPLVAAKAPGEPIRAWVAGAATGEEAYSVAMLTLEKLREARKNCPVQVFATDTNEDALAFARAATYPSGIAAHVPPELLNRYFTEIKDDHHYQVNADLRACVVFGMQNLFADPPFARMDLVTCRNLLIYLEPDVQRRVILVFHFALKPAGHLFLGSAETVGEREDLFKPVVRKWRIYRRIGAAPHDERGWRINREEPHIVPAASAQHRAPPRALAAVGIAQQVILERFAPASVLVNTKFEAAYFAGPTERYLAQPRGAPTRDLLSLVREGLRAQLRGALRKAAESDTTVEVPDARVKRGAAFEVVHITVAPTAGNDAHGRLFLVVFQDRPAAPGAGARKHEDAALVQQLEDELRVTRDDLQNTIERLETSNEELRVSNEEVVSINEELQSMNEELESSKEELQSLNEELNTVNQQLQLKLAELEGANNDLKNLLGSSDVATICLDRSLAIKWFTPATRAVLNILLTDLGRPIGDLASTLAGESLVRDARTVLERLVPIETELASEKGHWFIRRAIPYRTEDERIEGVIVTFTNVTESRRTAEAAIDARKAMTASLEDRVRDRTALVRSLAAELALAEERERQAIARDLHDDLGQVLNVAKLKVDNLLRSWRDAASQAPLRELEELVSQASRNVRSLTFQVSPPVLTELGLVPALQWLAEDMQRTHGIAVEVEDDGASKPLGQAARSLVFRAVRELLINVSKHAKVTSARVETKRSSDDLVVTVSDAGVGFDAAQVLGPSPPGFGLLSVRERLEFIGGTTAITSVPGSGTVVTLDVPLQAAEETDRETAK
jgi:chemotaxis methyl-accepting protein methylase/signal transduction histidine kinase